MNDIHSAFSVGRTRLAYPFSIGSQQDFTSIEGIDEQDRGVLITNRVHAAACVHSILRECERRWAGGSTAHDRWRKAYLLVVVGVVVVFFGAVVLFGAFAFTGLV